MRERQFLIESGIKEIMVYLKAILSPDIAFTFWGIICLKEDKICF